MGRMGAPDRMQASEEAIRRSALRKILDALPDPDAAPPRSRDCAACGEPIAPARLRALPSARNCIACQREIEEGR